jgi:hypothetical protein
MVQAAEHGDRGQLTACGCSGRSEPSRARGRLGTQAAMRAAVVIADVLVQDAFGVALAADRHVVETVATERPWRKVLQCCPQVPRSVLRDRARRDAPAELRELAGDPVFPPTGGSLATSAGSGPSTRRRSAAGRPDRGIASATNCAMPHGATGEPSRVARRLQSQGGSAFALRGSRSASGPVGEAGDVATSVGAR